MIESYNFFIGKVCTILTTSVALPIKDALSGALYFSGLVAKVDDNGIWIQQLETNTMSYFTFPIVGIVQEQAVAKSDPNYEKIKEEIEKQKPVAPPKPVPPNFTSVSDLTQKAKELRRRKEEGK
jgi:hypothetical protein